MKSVFNDFMNDDTKALISNKSIINVEINEIERNSLNKAPMIDLELLAEALKREGIRNPLVAYKTETGKYKLISGERRWTSAKHAGLNIVPLITIDQPKTIAAERMAILDFNSQREDTTDYINSRVQEYSEIYDLLINDGTAIPGRKRDWISEQMGGQIKGRMVQEYLTGSHSLSSEAQNKQQSEKLFDINKLIKKTHKFCVELDQVEDELNFQENDQLKELLTHLSELSNNANKLKSLIDEKVNQRQSG